MGVSMTEAVLYLKIDQSIEVQSGEVFLGDIARLDCSNKRIENRLKIMRIFQIENQKRGRYVVSVMEIIAVIHTVYPNLEVMNMGESDFIITYEINKGKFAGYHWIKTIFVCLITFFGAAFSIMTFNNDVDIPKLFGQIYYQLTGTISDGFTILEFTYSLGVGIGVLVFFNHFAGKKITSDPTPIEVEMQLYEDDVNHTLIEKNKKREDNLHVG